MALTEFQRTICRLIAHQRVMSGESYIAGAVALNQAINASRISQDIDVFHDTAEAVSRSWDADRELLKSHSYDLWDVKERAGFVEAAISKGTDTVVMQWTADSAFRFFPLVEHADFGLTLHPFDLATNKVLALVGRLEARDWIDVINCHRAIQPLGYLAWAASGKDPGFSPAAILDQAGRSARYSSPEIALLSFDGVAPDAAELSRDWHAMLDEAREIISALPASQVGKCVVDETGNLYRETIGQVRQELERGSVRFHEGRIHGSLPLLRDAN